MKKKEICLTEQRSYVTIELPPRPYHCFALKGQAAKRTPHHCPGRKYNDDANALPLAPTLFPPSHRVGAI